MQQWLQHLNELEVSLCRGASRLARRPWVQQPFAVISRLGDGVFWYSLMAVLPLIYGTAGLQASLHMLATGAAALTLYKSLKGMTRRERPFQFANDILVTVPPLDRYSFPSGHTLHAVSFTAVAIFHFPALAILLVPFTVLIGASRVVLGLHYPSDVLAATLIGLGIAYAGISTIA